jgi:hypothetical protein
MKPALAWFGVAANFICAPPRLRRYGETAFAF